MNDPVSTGSLIKLYLLVFVLLVCMLKCNAQSCLPDSEGLLTVCTPSALPVTPAAGISYIDPNFHAPISTVAAGMHQYSGISPLSRSGVNLHSIAPDGTPSIRLAKTGAVVTTGATVPYPECLWSNDSDDVCYWYQQSRIMAYHVSSDSSSVVLDLALQMPVGPISDGATTDLSSEEWIAVGSTADGIVCAVDLRAAKPYCAALPQDIVVSGYDYLSISRGKDRKTGVRYVIALSPAGVAIWHVDESERTLVLDSRPMYGPGMMANQLGPAFPTTPHGDMVQGSDGQQYFVEAEGYQGTFQGAYLAGLYFVTVRLSAGNQAFTDSSLGGGLTRTGIMVSNGWTWQSYHIGCSRQQPVCLISTDAAGDSVQDGRTPYLNTLLLEDFSASVPALRPIAFHHSSERQYWSQPRAALSFDGREAIFDSDFGADTVYVNIAATGYVAPPVLPAVPQVLPGSACHGRPAMRDPDNHHVLLCVQGQWARILADFGL